jgi:hypothetical protein
MNNWYIILVIYFFIFKLQINLFHFVFNLVLTKIFHLYYVDFILNYNFHINLLFHL